MSKPFENDNSHCLTSDEIAYIWQMLGQLRRMSDRNGTEMLCYLIDMAYLEAGDRHDRLTGTKLDGH